MSDHQNADDRATVLATFTRREEASGAADQLRRKFGDDRLELRVGDRDDTLDALAINQRAELNEAVVTVAAGLWSGPMVRGGLVGGLVGLIVGAVAAMPFLLFVDWPARDGLTFVLAVAAAGALGVASATFLIGAVRRAQHEGEFTPEDPWAVLWARMDRDLLDQVTSLLSETGARSIRHVTAPVRRLAADEVETPRVNVARSSTDRWPSSQAGAESDSA